MPFDLNPKIIKTTFREDTSRETISITVLQRSTFSASKSIPRDRSGPGVKAIHYSGSSLTC